MRISPHVSGWFSGVTDDGLTGARLEGTDTGCVSNSALLPTRAARVTCSYYALSTAVSQGSAISFQTRFITLFVYICKSVWIMEFYIYNILKYCYNLTLYYNNIIIHLK